MQTNIGRNEPLLKEGFATDIQVAGQKARASELQSTIASDQAAVAYAQTELDYAARR